MSINVRRVFYFYATVKDQPGEAYGLLSELANEGVNLLAFSAVPVGLEATQLALFPEQPELLVRAAESAGVTLIGPQRAYIIRGDDKLGALAEVHRNLYDAGINVYASNGVTDGRDGFGYVLFVRPEDYENAARVLGA